MNVIEPTIEGKVVAVCAAPKHRFSKTPCLSITLVAGLGVKGDAHFGSFVKHRYLARRNPRALNTRQVHLIQVDLFDELETAGYDIAPGDLGENITTVGLDLERLPLETDLRIGSAIIRLTGLRTPCVLIDRFQSRTEDAPGGGWVRSTFPSGRHGRRDWGRRGSARRSIRTVVPAAPRRALPAI